MKCNPAYSSRFYHNVFSDILAPIRAYKIRSGNKCRLKAIN